MCDWDGYLWNGGQGQEGEKQAPEEEHAEKHEEAYKCDEVAYSDAGSSCMGGCFPLIEDSDEEDEIGHDVNCSGCHSGK